MSQVLILLGRDSGFDGWLRVGEDELLRGDSLDTLTVTNEDRVVAVAPGEALVLHWLELEPGLTPPQAAAAARLLLAEQSARPIGELHVAVGREVAEESGRCVALVPVETMSDWIGRLAEAGFESAAIVPELLLLPVPDEGFIRYDHGGVSLFRARSEAFAIEPDVAGLVVGSRPLATIDAAVVEAGIRDLVADPLVDLRQGAFARRRQWRFDPVLARRLALLLIALLLVTLAIQVAAILRYTFAADATEAEARVVAARALPRSPGVTNPAAELSERLSELRGAGAGYGATSAALFEAIKAVPSVELNALSFSADGSLRATLAADNPATLADVARRVEDSGFRTELGPPRSGGGRRIADLTVLPS
jgi:general secretion pathway protein L